MRATTSYCSLQLLILSENLDAAVDWRFDQFDGKDNGLTASQMPYAATEGELSGRRRRSLLEEEVVRDYQNRRLGQEEVLRGAFRVVGLDAGVYWNSSIQLDGTKSLLTGIIEASLQCLSSNQWSP